jgi:hypothetical protein
MDKKPDREEKVIRFGCGSIFGLFIGLTISLDLSGSWAAPIAIVIAITLGAMAVKHGDRFWEKVAEWWNPWWRH